MSDTTNGDDGKGRGKRPTGRGPEGGRPKSRGGPPRAGAAPRASKPGEKRPFRSRPDGDRVGRSKAPEEQRERSDEARKPFADKKPFAARGEPRAYRDRSAPAGKPAAGGERRDLAREATPDAGGRAGDAPRKAFRPREDRAPRSDGGEQREPFKPRSHGMMSHGGAKSGEAGAGRPKSHSRLSHGDVATGERKPRPLNRPDRAGESATAAAAEPMRIAKRLARAGIASRRDAEGMIADGRVKVNGRVLDSPALDVSGSDVIEVDNAPLPAIERTRLWLFHKPAGCVTTNRDPENRPTVFDRLPGDMPRVLSVGRLDIGTEGLLLLTNDGGLARILELPSTGWLRRYRVRAHGRISQARLDELRQGVAVEGVFYGAIEATLDREQGSNVWLTLGLREGKNREVKRVLAHLGLEVNRLIRLSFGPFQLGDLEEGAVREIRGRTLRDQLGERLIAEAGADFDAPLSQPFSSQPVKAERADGSRTPEAPKAGGEWVSATDATPNRRKQRADWREDQLGRLDTRTARPTERGGERKAFGGKDPRPARGERPERPARSFDKPRFDKGGERGERGADRPAPAKKPFGSPKRSANVWMAPGARPQGEKSAPGKANKPEGPRGRGPSRGEKRGERARNGPPAGGRPGPKPRRDRD